jgi:arginyl-tRNA--protein-N-Asp/Glu arginylyltransferase
MNSRDTLISRALKLAELAKRGVGGEAENAARFLDLHLKKYDLTLEDLEREETSFHTYRYANKFEHDLLIQVICKVLDVATFQTYKNRGRSRAKELIVKVTVAQGVEISMRYDVYRPELKKELRRIIQIMHGLDRVNVPVKANRMLEEAA